MSLREMIQILPKVELHLHIEGSLEPELLVELADKHQIDMPYKSVEEVREAYQFEDLQSFLDLYYLGASVLIDEEDFYQLMWCYLLKCKEDNVVHAEIMFDPQTHTQRGIGYDVFMPGFMRAINQAREEWGMSCYLILSFLRHLSEQSAYQTLEEATEYLQYVKAVGLDSSELGNPPEKFEGVFAKAKSIGLLRVAHAGEEGPPEYIWGAIKTLDVQRIDHGVRCREDKELMNSLHQSRMPLTVCPLSNIKLRVFDQMKDHNILGLLEDGLCVTVNADDPSYFGGYLNDNYQALADSLAMTSQQLAKLVRNSFEGSFLPEDEKQRWYQEIDQVLTRTTN